MRGFRAGIVVPAAVVLLCISGCPDDGVKADDTGGAAAGETGGEGDVDTDTDSDGDSDSDSDSDADGDTDADSDSGGETGDTGEDVDTPWVDGDMGDCEGGTEMTSEFDGGEIYFYWDGDGRGWGPLEIEGEGTICGATCTHDYAWVHLWYFDGWSDERVMLPATVSYSGRPDGQWYLSVGTEPGPASDVGETITCDVNSSGGMWTATIEVREAE